MNFLSASDLGEVCLTKIRDFLSIQDACAFQTASKAIQHLIWRSIWRYSPIPLNVRFKNNDTDDDDTSPRFVLRSSSLVTMYINTFKGENICFKEVDCPKLELISTHHHSTCDVILDGPVNTAPGFQMHAGDHWNMLRENLSDTEKVSWHNEFPFLRREKQQCLQQELVMIRGSRRKYTSRYVPTINLALPDVPLTLIDRNR